MLAKTRTHACRNLLPRSQLLYCWRPGERWNCSATRPAGSPRAHNWRSGFAASLPTERRTSRWLSSCERGVSLPYCGCGSIGWFTAGSSGATRPIARAQNPELHSNPAPYTLKLCTALRMQRQLWVNARDACGFMAAGERMRTSHQKTLCSNISLFSVSGEQLRSFLNEHSIDLCLCKSLDLDHRPITSSPTSSQALSVSLLPFSSSSLLFYFFMI